MQPNPETPPTQTTGPRGNHILMLILGGCAGLALCVLIACAAFGGIWSVVQRTTVSNAEITSGNGGSTQGSLQAGNAENGEQIFNGDGSCSACHATSSDTRIVGPSLLGIGSRAETNKDGLSAEQYIYQSIVNPDGYIADGFQAGIMPPNFGQRLDEQQLADLIAFLLGK